MDLLILQARITMSKRLYETLASPHKLEIKVKLERYEKIISKICHESQFNDNEARDENSERKVIKVFILFCIQSGIPRTWDKGVY